MNRMYRNTVLFKWRKETTSQQKLEMRQRTAYLSFACPTVVALDFGENIGQDPTNFHFAVIFDFRDEEGWLAYDESEAHLQAASINAVVCQGNLTAKIRRPYDGPPSKRGMIRHVAMYRWQTGVSDELKAAVWEDLNRLTTSGPALQALRYAHGTRITNRQATDFDWAVEAHFDRVGAFDAFAGHPAYLRLQESIRRATVDEAKLQHVMLLG